MFHLLCGTQDEKSSEGHTGVALPGRQGHLAEGEEPSGSGVSGARVSAFAFTSRGRSSHGPAVLSARASGPRALTAWHSSQLSLADVSILASPQDCLRGVSVLTSSADYAIDYRSIF